MRTTKGAARNQAKKRLFKKTKGYTGGRGTLLRSAKETLVRAGAYAFRDRRVRSASSASCGSSALTPPAASAGYGTASS